MTKRVLTAFLSAALLLVSCSVRESVDRTEGENVLTLSLDPGNLKLTRATAYGEDLFNENVIKNFRLYFYPAGSTDDEEAVYVYPPSGFALDPANEATAIGATTGVDPTTGKVTVRMKLAQEYVDALFPSSSSCRVYAVANLKGVAESPASTSVNALKSIVLTSSFGPDESVLEDPYTKTQDSFAMDGEGAVAYNPSMRTASGEVPMSRAASKITLKVTKVSNDGVEDKEWTPQTDGMRVSFINGINRGYLNALMTKESRQGASGEYQFSFKSPTSNMARRLTGDETKGWTHELPFYSYYSLWRDAENPSNADCGSAPYLLLSLPWKHGADERYFTCYYAVPFNNVEGRLDRNTWYQINLSVGILGSGDPDNPTELYPSYMVLPWGKEVVTNAHLMRYRYLMVDRNTYEMHNIDALSIPFISSHEVEVYDANLTYLNLYPNSDENKYKPVTMEESPRNFSCTVDNAAQTMTFRHNLNNEYGYGLHVSAYTLKVRLRHIDRPEFFEDLTIVQYPALYVKAELNSRSKTPEKGITGDDNASEGYTFVNGNQDYSGSYWQMVYDFPGGSTGSNYDPYMYIVSASSLPSGSNLVIGDPREEEYTDLSEFNTTFGWGGRVNYWATTANSISRGTNVRLAEYYPTRSTTDTENMIAPSFRIASSFGVVLSISYNDAKKRCAAYQEDGYPAGRWRVPTKAEIYYMVMLKTYDRIPELLSPGSYYWGSNKKAYSPSGSGDEILETTGGNNTHVRCVYDEWYWNDINESNKTKYRGTFIWGDKKK